MACKGKMELTIGVAVGSSIQIAAGMIPLLVIIAWPLQRDLTLFFHNFDTIIMFVSVMLVNLLLQDGRTNWLEGLMREYSGRCVANISHDPLRRHCPQLHCRLINSAAPLRLTVSPQDTPPRPVYQRSIL